MSKVAIIKGEIIGHTDELWASVTGTNLTGSFKMIRTVTPLMKAQGWERIVNLTSVTAHNVMPENGAYCASKAGLLGHGRSVSLEGAIGLKSITL